MILNLGCGSRTSPHCVNVDWSPYLRLKRSPVGSKLAPAMLRGERRKRFEELDEDVVVHDLRKGIPAADGSADAVYHSHVLEHLDRDLVPAFLSEVRRALRPGGIQRIVVPDLENGCRNYLAHLETCTVDPGSAADHDRYVGEIIEQIARREPTGASRQTALRRRVEYLLLGDARRRGETHQWMWDRFNLSAVLGDAGFQNVAVADYRTSAVPGWDEIRLDELANGDEYIPGSLYVEATR